MKYIILLILVMCSVITTIQAQDTQEKPSEIGGEFRDNLKKSALGVSFSSYTGSGIYYVRPITIRSNISFTGIFWYMQDDNSNKKTYSFGLEYQYDLRETSLTRMYFNIASSLYGNSYNDLDYNLNDDSDIIFVHGLGMGAELNSKVLDIVFGLKVGYQLGFDNGLKYAGLGGGLYLGYNF